MAWKMLGETPLQCMHRTLREHGFSSSTKSCYCGRLDPMAQGVTVFLTGDMLTSENIARWNSCRKTYRFCAVLGVHTDSYDCLGHISISEDIGASHVHSYDAALMALNGQEVWQEFPPLSAYRYKGRPLWVHARRGTLPQPMPGAMRQIYSITRKEKPRVMSMADYRAMVLDDISQLQSPEEFSVSTIREGWQKMGGLVHLLEYEAVVSSGTYIRGLVADTGRQLGIPAHAWRITRQGLSPK